MPRSALRKLFALTLALMASGCAKIYTAPNAEDALAVHKEIAVLPAIVSITSAKKVEAEAIKNQQLQQGKVFQDHIYEWMLRRKQQERVTAKLQNVQSTNAKLSEAGYLDKLALTEPARVCEALGVDGYLTTTFNIDKPMTEGAAVAIYAVTALMGSGVSANTNEVKASVSVHDCKSNELMWRFDRSIDGSLGSSPERMVNYLMKRASKRLPY
jgi:hypothetical protein